MINTFKIGDKVEVLDGNERGIITRIKGDFISVNFDDGFEQDFLPNELILLQDFDLNIEDFKEFKPIEHSRRHQINSYNKKRLKDHEPKLDLHIHELIDDARRLSNFEILNIQLSKAKGFVEWAISNRVPKVVLIHGKGEGVLKEELRTLLRRYDNLEYYDADYMKYGLGATEVRIYGQVTS